MAKGGSNDGSVDADANVSVDNDGVGADGSVSVGDNDGAKANADVSVGGGDGADAGGNVSVGGNTGSGGGTGGGGTGGNSTDGSGAGGRTGGGMTGAMMDSDNARNVILGNGQPAAAQIGLIVYSSDGVPLGVVSDIIGFDGTKTRLALVPNSSLGLSRNLVLIDVPVSRLTQSELRLSITAAEFVRIVSA